MFVRLELMYMLPIRRPSKSDTPSPFRLPCAWTCAPTFPQHAAHVGDAWTDGRHARRHLNPRAAAGHLLDNFLRDRSGERRRLHVNDGALACDRDRFFQSADAHVGVDGRCEVD
jgi:hypothetical protein